MNIVVELEGVLREPRNDIPIAQGVQFCGALSAYHQISIITEQDDKQAEQWLAQNKVVDYDHVIDRSVALEGKDLKQRQIDIARSKGRVDIVITSNPSLWVYCFDRGITAVLFNMPEYTEVENRPDAPKPRRRWDDIEAVVRRQNERRSEQVRNANARSDFRFE